jgi:hypothetical protein
MSDAATNYVGSLQTYDRTNNPDPTLSYDQATEAKAAPETVPVWQKQPFMDEPDNINKYKTIRDVKAKSRKLEVDVSKYMEKFRLYSQYMQERGGEWNDFKKRNDMSGLGSSPGDDNEAAGWFYMGDTDTLAECKRAALRDDKLYTRVVHYNPADGYKGNWKYGCYGSVVQSKTSANTGFNSNGVTTSDRTYWVDTPNSLILDPTNPDNRVDDSGPQSSTGVPIANQKVAPTAGRNYGGHFSLGKIYTSDGGVPDDAIGLYKCKERAKDPMSTGMFSYLKDKEFVSVTYFGKSYGEANSTWKGYCYAGGKDAKADKIPASGQNSQGVWSSKQTRCLTEDEKAKLVKELQDLYEDILRQKAVIDERMSIIMPLKPQFGQMLNESVYKIQFELQPKMNAYSAALKREEAAISKLDNVDSHIQMNSYRYKYVLYVTFVVALIAGIYYILTSENDTTYVTYALIGIVMSLVAFYAYSYFWPYLLSKVK